MSDATQRPEDTQGTEETQAPEDTQGTEETQAPIREPDPNAEPADGEMPSTEQLEEPSTEKEVGEEPKAENPHDPEPSHHAVGIGVIGGPQSIADEFDDE